MKTRDSIEQEILGWPGTESRPHRFSGVEFRAGHEIGHLHGEGLPMLADLPFPRKVREELVAAGKAQTYHVLPQTAPRVTASGVNGVAGALDLFRRNYERLTSRKGVGA